MSLITSHRTQLKKIALVLLFSTSAHASTCEKPIYLTFDTGNMDVAEYVAGVLKKHDVKATFFLANEKTKRGDYSLDDSWSEFWKSLKRDGHAFGNHTYHHTYFVKDAEKNSAKIRPQFGPHAGKTITTSQSALCSELQLVNDRFQKMTGSPLNKIWRAPGGKVSPNYIEMGHSCGYTHVGWSEAGFLGDELSSEKFSNQHLLDKALKSLRPGDVAMAHLGIWSRKDPWAPVVLEPLIVGLKKKGYCFDTILGIQQHRQISRIMKS